MDDNKLPNNGCIAASAYKLVREDVIPPHPSDVPYDRDEHEQLLIDPKRRIPGHLPNDAGLLTDDESSVLRHRTAAELRRVECRIDINAMLDIFNHNDAVLRNRFQSDAAKPASQAEEVLLRTMVCEPFQLLRVATLLPLRCYLPLLHLLHGRNPPRRRWLWTIEFK